MNSLPSADDRPGPVPLAILAAGVAIAASSLAAQDIVDVVRFEISPVEVHEIAARAVDQTYRIQVKMPPARPRSKHRFGVLYLTDINSSMGALADEVHLMGIAGEIPPLIVVGIGYPVDSTAQALMVRARDLTPIADTGLLKQGIYRPWIRGTLVPSAHKDGGGGADFLRFLHEELIPFIDERYPTSDDRAFFGDSLGGLFGLYALFERPETFSRYILGSPSTWVADEWIMKKAAVASEQLDDLEARVFLGVGADEEKGELARFEMVSNARELHTLLEQKDLPSLEVESYEFPGESHNSVVLMNLMRGLRSVYDPEPNTLIDAMKKALGPERRRGRP